MHSYAHAAVSADARVSTTPRRSPARAIGLGGGVAIVYVLPVFLTGALSVEIMRDLAFGSAGLGLAVGAHRFAGAIMSPYLGRWADRLGATRSIRLTALIAMAASLGIATTATRWAILVAWMTVGGCAQALGTPAANRLLSNVIRPARLGTAFGIKQSAPPTATMLAGLSVPVIALTIGWRWAYVAAALLGVVVIFAAGRPPPVDPRRRAESAGSRLADRRMILLLAVAFGLGNATSSTVTTFYVDAAVRAGTSADFAGTMLAVASIATIITRVVSGAVSDRLSTGHLRLCAGLLVVGSIGIAMLATGRPAWMAAGALVGLAGTWGFGGVFWFALVRAYPDAPGQASGAIAPGVLGGSTAGPVVFGFIADSAGFAVAWTFIGVVALVAAGAALVCSRKLARRQASSV